jgi:hypothetical protein
VKYIIIATSAAVVLAMLAFIGNGYLNTRRADRKADDVRAKVHAMTLQDLAAAIARCDEAPAPAEPERGVQRHDAIRRDVFRRDAAYCEDVTRELDNRPLEIVKVKPADAQVLPR